MRAVKEIALDAPILVVHLVPFGARIDEDLHLIELQSTIARFRRGVRFGDEPSRPLAVQNFFAIGGNREAVDTAEERLSLSRCQIKLRDGYRRSPFIESRHIDDFRKKQSPGFACVQAYIVGGLDGQSHDSLSDAGQINLDLNWLLLLFAFFTFFAFLGLAGFLALRSLFVLVLLFAFVSACGIFLLFACLFFVALRLGLRTISFLKHFPVTSSL